MVKHHLLLRSYHSYPNPRYNFQQYVTSTRIVEKNKLKIRLLCARLYAQQCAIKFRQDIIL